MKKLLTNVAVDDKIYKSLVDALGEENLKNLLDSSEKAVEALEHTMKSNSQKV